MHISEFGCLKYAHVSIDTYSCFLMATTHTREKAQDAIWHWFTCFSTLGLPHAIKMNNVHALTHNFWQQWGVSHHMGIPHSHRARYVECAYKTLKTMLEKRKRGVLGCPHDRLAKAWHVLNF